MRTTVALILVIFGLVGGLYFTPPVQDLLSGAAPLAHPAPSLPEDDLPLALPEGFDAGIFAHDIPGVRVITHGPGASLYATQTHEGRIVALIDADNDGESDRTETILDELQRPHGIIFTCADVEQTDCTLHVAQEHRVSTYDFDPETRTASNRETLLELPADGGHNTRTIMLHPNGEQLLVSIGSSCNACEEDDERRAAVLYVDIETGEIESRATGLRNTVFMAVHPATGEVWGTDMGRDHLGDDLPPDEINIIRADENYGWPICYGKNVHDTEYDKSTYVRAPCTEPFETPSHIDITPAHSAPLGIAFVPEEGWPEEYWYDALVAYHGSWNRSIPTGYKVVRFPLDAQGNPEGAPVDFLTGFIDEENVIYGRPVDILVEPGGIVYVSDDRAGTILRITRTQE